MFNRDTEFQYHRGYYTIRMPNKLSNIFNSPSIHNGHLCDLCGKRTKVLST